MVSVNFSKRDLKWMIPLILILVVGFAFAYTYDGSGNPEVMGHSADELNISMGTFASGANGEATMANGMQMKWGTVTLSGTGGAVLWSDLGLSDFDNSGLQVFGTNMVVASAYNKGIDTYDITKSGFTLTIADASGTWSVRVFAIGY